MQRVIPLFYPKTLYKISRIYLTSFLLFLSNLVYFRIIFNMNNNQIDRRALTTSAFLIGLALIDNLTPTEQSAIGNYIMLIGQTLCTNGSYTFNDQWKGVNKDTLQKVNNIIKDGINRL